MGLILLLLLMAIGLSLGESGVYSTEEGDGVEREWKNASFPGGSKLETGQVRLWNLCPSLSAPPFFLLLLSYPLSYSKPPHLRPHLGLTPRCPVLKTWLNQLQ